MPPVLQPALKKQKTVRVFTTDQKRWLIELSENNPEFRHSRLAQDFKDECGGDVWPSSTVSDWLKPAAVRKVLDLSKQDSAEGVRLNEAILYPKNITFEFEKKSTGCRNMTTTFLSCRCNFWSTWQSFFHCIPKKNTGQKHPINM